MLKKIFQLSILHLYVRGQKLVLCQIHLKKGDRIVQDRLAVLAFPRIGRTQLLVHLLEFAHPVFEPFRAVIDKDIKNIAVRLRMHKVSIILDPPDRSILLDDAVLHIVKIIDAVRDLALDAPLHLIDIVGVYHPPECISCEPAKLLLCITAKNPQHGTVDIQQLLATACAVDKKTSRHPLQYRFDAGKCTRIKSHSFVIHFMLHMNPPLPSCPFFIFIIYHFSRQKNHKNEKGLKRNEI